MQILSNVAPPVLSAIVVTPDDYSTVRRCVGYLRAQTIQHQLEIVFVAPSLAGLGVDREVVADFARVVAIEVGPIESVACARAAGVRAASASIVVLTEDHSFPHPDWAAALVHAHAGPWSAVGPAVGNANPRGLLTWAGYFIQYGRWAAPLPSGEIDDLPGHNSSYKRDVLLALGGRLDSLLEAETVLHGALRRRGQRLYLEGQARTDHLNVSIMSTFIREHFQYGRLFGGARASGWSWARRGLYIGAGPLIPLVRLARIVPEIVRTGRGSLLPAVLPAMLLALISSACGEMVAYAVGMGDASKIVARLEFHRARHLSPADRRAVEG